MHFTTYTKLHQLSFSGAETVTETPTYEQPLPGALSDRSPEYTKMTTKSRGETHKTLAKVESDYLELSTGVVGSPDYQRPLPAPPVKTTPTYAALTKGPSSPNTAEGEPDYIDVTE